MLAMEPASTAWPSGPLFPLPPLATTVRRTDRGKSWYQEWREVLSETSRSIPGAGRQCLSAPRPTGNVRHERSRDVGEEAQRRPFQYYDISGVIEKHDCRNACQAKPNHVERTNLLMFRRYQKSRPRSQDEVHGARSGSDEPLRFVKQRACQIPIEQRDGERALNNPSSE